MSYDAYGLHEPTLEELSQKLEAIEKDNEQSRRENQLFESYLLRQIKDDRIDIDFEEKKQKGGRRPQQKLEANQKVVLSAEEKYEIANAELETLRKNIEEGREKSEALLEKLKAILEGTDLSIAEIRKEAFDFGRFLTGAEHGRTGKYDAEKLIKYMEEKFRQKDALIDKLQLKNISLKTQIMKAEQQIKHKEEMGDDLKFIDFHQLQIENKKHVKDIDERNKKLLSLKMSTGKTVQQLNSLKKKLNDAMRESAKVERDIAERNDSLDIVRKNIEEVKKEAEESKRDNKKLALQQEKTRDMPKVMDYVQEKQKVQELQKAVRDWNRKIEIAELAAKKMKTMMRKTQTDQANMI